MKKNCTFVSFAGMLTGMCSKSRRKRERGRRPASKHEYLCKFKYRQDTRSLFKVARTGRKPPAKNRIEK